MLQALRTYQEHKMNFRNLLSVAKQVGALFGLLLLPLCAQAQQPVLTIPTPATSAGGNSSGTIASTNTFQKLWSSSPSPGSSGLGGSRRGCTIQNNGTHNMFVSEGLTTGTASLTNSVILLPSATYYCQWNGIVLQGEIDITGTSGEAFYAAQE